MSEPAGDHESRIRVLEHEIQELRERLSHATGDAAAARVLAGGADRDVGDMRAQLRAHTQTLNALRETQVEQGGAILGLRADVTDLRADVTDLRGEVVDLRAEMRGGFAEMRTGMAHIVTLIERVERRGSE